MSLSQRLQFSGWLNHLLILKQVSHCPSFPLYAWSAFWVNLLTVINGPYDRNYSKMTNLTVSWKERKRVKSRSKCGLKVGTSECMVKG